MCCRTCTLPSLQCIDPPAAALPEAWFEGGPTSCFQDIITTGLATSELMKRQQSMDANKNPRKLIQYVKTRWNSVFDTMERLLDFRWPVLAVLSDRTITKLSDAKTLDMKDEHWTLDVYFQTFNVIE